MEEGETVSGSQVRAEVAGEEGIACCEGVTAGVEVAEGVTSRSEEAEGVTSWGEDGKG